jgi:alcohol dehydrogenase class IV
MNIFRKVYCRLFQGAFKIAMPLLPYREPKLIEGVSGIKTVLQNNSIDNVLIVTDSVISGLGLVDGLKNDLTNAEIKFAIFEDVVPNPTIKNIEDGVKVYIENGCNAIIAFGGGSVMDCAKIIGARVANPNQSVQKMKGLLKIRNKTPLLFAIPTTAGTGSETTLAAVITDGETKHKYPINDFCLIPSFAVLDAELTLGLPKNITSTTGMDALTHAVEAYIGNSTTKYTRTCALEAIKLIMDNLMVAYNDGNNKDARQNMLKAAYLAGIAFTRSYVGYIHAVAHSLGGEYKTPHGLANAVILPHMLELYGEKIYKKLKEIAVYIGLATAEDPDDVASKKFILKIQEMNKMMEIPEKFDFIKEEDLDMLADHADNEGNPLYPVPVLMDKEELKSIYAKIMK